MPFVVLHPQKGIALVDTDPPEAAVAPLEDFLARRGGLAVQAGALPIVPVAMDARALDEVAERLDGALAAKAGARGNPNWCQAVASVLCRAPDLMLTRLRRVAPAMADAVRPDDPADPLLRIGTLRPDSALIEWAPPRNWRPLAVVVSLLLVTIGARALQEYGPSPFHAVAMPRPTVAAPMLHAGAAVLAHAMILPVSLPTITVTKTTPETNESVPSTPPLTTLMLPRPVVVTSQPKPIATPQPKPATPAWFKDADNRQRRPRRSRVASARPQPNTTSVVVSRGPTTISEAGLTGFVAPGAGKADVIPANVGAARLASGTTATLDFYGDGLVNIAVSGATLAQALDSSTGRPLDATVDGTGTLKVGRGTVLVGANVAADAVDNVVNTSGVTEARSVAQQSGQIVLDGGASGTVQITSTNNAPSDPSGDKAVVAGAPCAKHLRYSSSRHLHAGSDRHA